MNCDTTRSLLSDYLYDELDATTRDEFESHLATCSTCAESVASLQETVTVMQEFASREPMRNNSLSNDDFQDPTLPRLSLQLVLTQSLERANNRHRRQRLVSALAMSIASVLAVIIGLAAQVEVNGHSLTIAWADAPAASDAPPADADHLSSRLQQTLLRHEERLAELDTLIELVANEIESNAQRNDQLVMTLSRWMRHNLIENDKRWKTVSRGMHQMHLTRVNAHDSSLNN